MTAQEHQARTVPHDLDAEEALLGSMMLSRDATRAATNEGVSPADFYKPSHALIYAAIIDVDNAGHLPDPVTIAARLGGSTDQTLDRRALNELAARTPASANAEAYAAIIRGHARRRELIATATELSEAAYNGTDPTQTVARLALVTAPADIRERAITGGAFTYDTPQVDALWGTDDQVLWSPGESLMIVGPAGVGKTTLTVQLVAARIGLTDTVLEMPVTTCRRILYFACDRPSQIERAFRRYFSEEDRELLDEHVIVWKGPPPQDFARHPKALSALCAELGADCAIIDSLKDVALGISDDEVGAGLNSAIQHALADGIDVCALHHQRKGQQGTKPKTLEDVYGSTWITAGAGSVVLLWGKAGDPIVELSHLKQPAGEVGPIELAHDHADGTTAVFRGQVDPLTVLRNTARGITANDLAVLQTHKEKPSEGERRKAKYRLDNLIGKQLAYKVPGQHGGNTGTEPDRYFATIPDNGDTF